MDRLRDILAGEVVVGNLGSRLFADSIRLQGKSAFQVEWTVPCGGDEGAFDTLRRIETADVVADGKRVRLAELVRAANSRALDIINESHPVVVGLGRAAEAIPGMSDDLVLHAGPPIAWDRMCGPMKGAIVGALIYEGRAGDPAEAERLAKSGKIRFEPCHHHAAVGPMAGVVSPSMPVWIVENKSCGGRAFATLNEGLGKVLRFGAFGPEVIDRLRWMEKVLAPVLRQAVESHGPVDLRALIAQALQMGDEGHNRNRAGTSLLIREIAPAVAAADAGNEVKGEILKFMHSNDHFFLNLSMAAAKSCLDAIADIPWCTLVSAMARNGTDFGIRVSGLGPRWFTAPAPRVKGLYFAGFGEADANPDLGDSTICETYGIGGFAMAAAPAIVQFVGGRPSDAERLTLAMYEITAGESRNYRIPSLGFRGTPTGIDIMKVTEGALAPVVNTGIAHKDAGVGQVGAGLVEPPLACFKEALAAFWESVAAQGEAQGHHTDGGRA
ncbi:MAG: DUF1116 domain-containing protein [bacterium]